MHAQDKLDAEKDVQQQEDPRVWKTLDKSMNQRQLGWTDNIRHWIDGARDMAERLQGVANSLIGYGYIVSSS